MKLIIYLEKRTTKIDAKHLECHLVNNLIDTEFRDIIKNIKLKEMKKYEQRKRKTRRTKSCRALW